MKYRKLFVRTAAGLLCLSLFSAACPGRFPVQAEEEQSALYAYNAYQKRLEGVKKEADIAASGFDIIENQVFTMTVKAFGDVSMIPAIDRTYHRLVLFFADENGNRSIRRISWRQTIRSEGSLISSIRGFPPFLFRI